MKINKMFLYAAAFMLAAACGKDDLPETVTPEGGNEGEVVTPAPEYAVSFTAYTENTSVSKVTIGTNTSGNLQTFWEDGDEISVYSSNYAVSDNTRQSYKFTTALTENSTSATFRYVGEEDFVEGNYFAVYPYFENKKTVNYTDYRMDKFDIPQAQTLVAGAFDRSAMIMTAYTENLGELHFKNAVALVKFKVADADVVSGKIDAVADAISGRFLAVIDKTTLVPALTDYGKTTATYVEFSAEESAALATGVEYYVAVRPTELSAGFHIYLNDVLVKSYPRVEAFERNKIYDLGTLTIPENQGDEPAVTKTLSFDFTAEAADIQTGYWPTGSRTEKNGDDISDVECEYNLDGVNYSFLCADCPDKTAAKTYWDKTKGYVIVSGAGRYLGLPVIEGWKLVKVECLHGSSTSSKNGGRGLAVTSNITDSSVTPTYVMGGDPQLTTTTGDTLTYNLEQTYAGTRYYLNGSNTAIGLSNITLTYEQVK